MTDVDLVDEHVIRVTAQFALIGSSNAEGVRCPRKSGSRIWRALVDGSEHPEPMFWEAVTNFVPSSDGRWMYFTEVDGPTVSLIRRSLKDGTSEILFTTPGNPAFTNSIQTARGLVYIAVTLADNSQADVFQIAPETRIARLVTHLTGLPSYEASGFAVSPDARSMVVTKTTRNLSSLNFETLK